MIVGVLLAAGLGRRFGGDKLLAPLGGRPVVRWSAAALAAAVDRVLVVLPPGADLLRAALDGLHVDFVEHALRREGMASSIRAGVAALPADAEAFVVALGDQPLVDSALVAQLCARWRETRAPAVVPRYADGTGHPVLFDRACAPALMRLEGDRGARPVLEALGDAAVHVDVPSAMPSDVDTPDALLGVARQAGLTSS